MENVDKLKELVKALDEIVELGEALMADGKVDFADLKQLPDVAPIASKLMEAWKNKEELVAEIRDLDYAELIELLGVAAE